MSDLPLYAYWAPGCTACLRMKEFLRKHKVPFKSVNVMEEANGLDDLRKLGIRQIPVLKRGDEWVDGQILADVARLAGVAIQQHSMLEPAELARRTQRFLRVSLALLEQLPEKQMDDALPDRPRTHRELSAHIFQIVQAFLDVFEKGRPLVFEDYLAIIPKDIRTKTDLMAYSRSISERFDRWCLSSLPKLDFRNRDDMPVYYGKQDAHQFMERSTWHCGQHVRQLEAVIESIGLTPTQTVLNADISGLPMPEHVYDDEVEISKRPAIPLYTCAS